MSRRSAHPEPHVLKHLPTHPGLPAEPAGEGDWYQVSLVPVTAGTPTKRWASLVAASSLPWPERVIVGRDGTRKADPRNARFLEHNARVKKGKPCTEPGCIHAELLTRRREVAWPRIEAVRELGLEGYHATLLASALWIPDDRIAEPWPLLLLSRRVDFGYGYVALGDHHSRYDPFDPTTFPESRPRLVDYPYQGQDGIEWRSEPYIPKPKTGKP